ELHFSTYKKSCSEKHTCPNFAPFCEAESKEGFISHLLLSSEPIHGENVWKPLKDGDIVAVGSHMRFFKQFSN
ncbi:hypothetical protein JYT19_00615, partial [Sulfobacillus acidophilus]|nr:hypothetical protein [Sulfobacillus acidophilus]